MAGVGNVVRQGHIEQLGLLFQIQAAAVAGSNIAAQRHIGQACRGGFAVDAATKGSPVGAEGERVQGQHRCLAVQTAAEDACNVVVESNFCEGQLLASLIDTGTPLRLSAADARQRHRDFIVGIERPTCPAGNIAGKRAAAERHKLIGLVQRPTVVRPIGGECGAVDRQLALAVHRPATLCGLIVRERAQADADPSTLVKDRTALVGPIAADRLPVQRGNAGTAVVDRAPIAAGAVADQRAG